MPAPTDPATLIVEVLVLDLGLRAGEAIPEHRLEERYTARGHGHDEIAEGLRHAHGLDWVRWDGLGGGTFFLTEAGFEAGDARDPLKNIGPELCKCTRRHPGGRGVMLVHPRPTCRI
jgi:hypothetical protein